MYTHICIWREGEIEKQESQFLTDFILVVFERILDWINRCDLASQAGLPKPEFKTTEGDDIFPANQEEQWWLTDISKRLQSDSKNEEENVEKDEYEIASGDEEDEPEKEEVSDDDPLSEPEQLGLGRTSASSKDHFKVSMAWSAAQ